MRVWRICKGKYANAAFSGEGARLFAGRWNSAGGRMVYCSASLALASLEFFVHLDPSIAPDDLGSMMAEIPDSVGIDQVDVKGLAPDWRTVDNPELQQIGDAWIQSMRSVGLLVPSAVVDGEWNVLFNPAHSDFSKIYLTEPKKFLFDARMFSR